MKGLKATISLLTAGVSLGLFSMTAQANSDVNIFSKMDADIATMWHQRDLIETAFIELGLVESEHLNEHHSHSNEHGVGGDSDVDDIDLLASNDLLADKINELSQPEAEKTDDTKTAFDSKNDMDDLSAAITLSKSSEEYTPRPASGTLLGVRPVNNAKVTSKYGYRRIFGRSQFHKGIDLAAKYGSPIYATGAGKVVYAGWMRGYGRFIEIDHQNGYKTRYAHSSRLRVKLGEMVTESQHIADLGCSGRCTGPHLHYEVKKHGKHMNPAIFLAMAPKG